MPISDPCRYSFLPSPNLNILVFATHPSIHYELLSPTYPLPAALTHLPTISCPRPPTTSYTHYPCTTSYPQSYTYYPSTTSCPHPLNHYQLLSLPTHYQLPSPTHLLPAALTPHPLSAALTNHPLPASLTHLPTTSCAHPKHSQCPPTHHQLLSITHSPTISCPQSPTHPP